MNELLNNCMFLGRLGKDVEVQHTPNGTMRATCSIALDMAKKVNDEWTKETTWVQLTALGKTAENLAKLAKKGAKILVSAIYSTYKYEKDGETKYGHSFLIRSFTVAEFAKDENYSGAKNSKPAAKKTATEEEQFTEDFGTQDGEDEFPF